MGVEVSLEEWGKGDKSGNGLLRLSTTALTLPWSCLCSSVFHKHCPRACSLNRSQGSLENTAYYIFLKFNRWNISEKSSHRTTCLSLLIDQFSMLLDQGTFFSPIVIENMLGTYYSVGPCYWSVVQRPVALACRISGSSENSGSTESEPAF